MEDSEIITLFSAQDEQAITEAQQALKRGHTHSLSRAFFRQCPLRKSMLFRPFGALTKQRFYGIILQG